MKKSFSHLLLSFLIFTFPVHVNALPVICIDEKLDECTAYYASKGLLGSGAALKGCVNWVSNGCFGDYDDLKNDIYNCNSDLYWCNFDSELCMAGYDVCSDGYDQCITERQACVAEQQACDRDVAGMDSIAAAHLRKIKRLKKKIKKLKRR